MTYAFQEIVHDRDALRRERDWLTTDVRVLCVGGEFIATNGSGHVRFFDLGEVEGAELAYLGAHEGSNYVAAIVQRVPAEYEPQSLRMIGSNLTALEGSLSTHAIGLAQWHRKHGRCAQCGGETAMAQAGHTRKCVVCGAQHFPRTDPAVIMLITDTADRALLGRQCAWPENRFSTLAGFVEPGESLEDAVRREVHEEVAIEVGTVQYGASQPWPFPSSLMVGFFGAASTTEIIVDEQEIAEARWFTRDEISDLTASEQLFLPGRLSISRWLIEQWHGGAITNQW